MKRVTVAALLTSAGLALNACATDSVTAGAAPPTNAREAERRQVLAEAEAQAAALEAAHRLPEALLRWRAALAVAPGDGAATGGVARVRAAIAARATALLALGDAARARRDFAGARSAYEQALDLAPDLAAPAEGLRAVETEATLQSIATGGAGGPGMQNGGAEGGQPVAKAAGGKKAVAKPKRAK